MEKTYFAVVSLVVFGGDRGVQDGQLGPGEIRGKREWLLRQTQWMAQRDSLPISMPAVHPFNPLPLLRLATAVTYPTLLREEHIESSDEEDNRRRRAVSDIFDFVWNSNGHDPRDAARLAELQRQVRRLNFAMLHNCSALLVAIQERWSCLGVWCEQHTHTHKDPTACASGIG